MFASRMGATAGSFHPPGGAPFAGEHEQVVAAKPAFGLEDERAQSAFIEARAADIAEIGRETFFGRIPKKLPGDLVESFWRGGSHGGKHQPHQRRAAFDVLGA